MPTCSAPRLIAGARRKGAPHLGQRQRELRWADFQALRLRRRAPPRPPLLTEARREIADAPLRCFRKRGYASARSGADWSARRRRPHSLWHVLQAGSLHDTSPAVYATVLDQAWPSQGLAPHRRALPPLRANYLPRLTPSSLPPTSGAFDKSKPERSESAAFARTRCEHGVADTRAVPSAEPE